MRPGEWIRRIEGRDEDLQLAYQLLWLLVSSQGMSVKYFHHLHNAMHSAPRTQQINKNNGHSRENV